MNSVILCHHSTWKNSCVTHNNCHLFIALGYSSGWTRGKETLSSCAVTRGMYRCSVIYDSSIMCYGQLSSEYCIVLVLQCCGSDVYLYFSVKKSSRTQVTTFFAISSYRSKIPNKKRQHLLLTCVNVSFKWLD